MAQGRPSAGDLTGRQKAQAAKEQREAAQERAVEMSMASAEENAAELNGVFDPKSGERVDQQGSHTAIVVDDPEPVYDREQVLTGKEDPDVVEAASVSKKIFSATTDAQVLKSPYATIRVDADIENMTYGMINGEPNNYNFKEGLAYKVPVAVAQHLNDRGLVRQWIG
jgi:hypothetical protein